jgi:hypothetical protein
MAKSIRQQIADAEAAVAKLNEKITELRTKAESEVDPATIVGGAEVQFTHGKGDNKKTLTGTVLGVRHAVEGEKGGDFAKVAVGQGFDAQVLTIGFYQVTKVVAGVPAPTDSNAPARV